MQAGFWVAATVMGIVWACLVRFGAVALQSVHSGYTRMLGVGVGEAALPALALVLVGLLPVALLSRTLRRK